MNYVIASGLAILNLLWLALSLVGLPGNWLMVATTGIVAWWRWDSAHRPGDQMFSVAVLVVLALLALAGEMIEMLSGWVGAKRAGGSGWGALGALLGTLVGGIAGTFVIPIPIVGSIVGACCGAASGALVMEFAIGRTTDDAVRSATGAGLGRAAGMAAKLSAGAGIWLIATTASFWP